jgi:hypothetical protein
MSRILGVLAVARLALELGACSACAGSAATTGGCCSISSEGCKAEGKTMACEKKAACCSTNKVPEGPPFQGHQD